VVGYRVMIGYLCGTCGCGVHENRYEYVVTGQAYNILNVGWLLVL
jgi:hypothetical protein